MKPLDHDSRRLLEDALAADAPSPAAEARIWDALSMRLDAPLPPTAAAAKAAFESNGAGFGGGANGGAASGGTSSGTGAAGGASGKAGSSIGAAGGANGGAGAGIGAGSVANGGAGAGLGAGAAVGASAGVGAGSAAVIGAKIVAGALVAAVSAGSLLWYANSAPQESATKAERAAAVAAAPPRSASAKPAGIAIAAEGPVAQAMQQGSAPADAQANTSSTPSLAEETQLLADAQRALSAGAPDRALALIEAHRARFPQGSLSPERQAARVVALCALGRVKEAARARAQFLRAWPSSPLASRVSAACPAPGARRAK